MKPIQFESSAYKDYIDWAKANEDIFYKINRLIIDIDRNLFKGLGKPEPLKGNFKGYWSRRITDEHRLVYKVEKDIICIYSCHGHYE
jgi:toxin YoeB